MPVEPPTGGYINEYGSITAMERQAALAPTPAVGLDLSEIDLNAVAVPAEGLLVWASLVYPNGAGRTVKAFA